MVALFKDLDKSGDNALDLDEFFLLIKNVDSNVTKEESTHVFKKFDVNGDQEISLEEFQTLIIETDYSNYEVNKDPFLQGKA